MVCSQNLYLGDSGSFRETALSVFQIFLTGRILEFTTDRFQNHCVDFDLVFFQARVQALSRVFPDYEDNAPTMSESAFNRMTYPRWEEGCKGVWWKLNQLSGRYLSLPVQYQRAHPALKEEVDLAVLVRGGLTLLQTLISLSKCEIPGRSTAWTAMTAQVTTQRRNWTPWSLTRINWKLIKINETADLELVIVLGWTKCELGYSHFWAGGAAQIWGNVVWLNIWSKNIMCEDIFLDNMYLVTLNTNDAILGVIIMQNCTHLLYKSEYINWPE